MRQTEMSGHSSFGKIAEATGGRQFVWNANQLTQNHFECKKFFFFSSYVFSRTKIHVISQCQCTSDSTELMPQKY